MDPFDGDALFSDLVYAALDHGRAALAGLTSGPLIPFAMTRVAEQREVVRFAGTNYDEDQQAALLFARGGAFAAWAVGWDGYLTLGGVRTEALFVRARRADGQRELLFAWRYARESGAPQTIGNPAFLGYPD